MIRRALDRASNSRSEAAKLLGISRFALSRLIQKLSAE
jgi:transcriptional regulator with PAS, ATPase and Fis domain